MATKIDICNLALQNVQQAAISSLDEGSAESRAVLTRYDHARDVVLQAMWWGFAKRVEPLALLVETPAQWSYAYQTPDDLIRARYILPASGRLSAPVRYERAGNQIWTDEESARLAFTYRVVDEAQFHPMFVDALAWRIGADIVLSLNGKRSERADALQIYRGVLAEARASDANESSPFTLTDTEADWIRERA